MGKTAFRKRHVCRNFPNRKVGLRFDPESADALRNPFIDFDRKQFVAIFDLLEHLATNLFTFHAFNRHSIEFLKNRQKTLDDWDRNSWKTFARQDREQGLRRLRFWHQDNQSEFMIASVNRVRLSRGDNCRFKFLPRCIRRRLQKKFPFERNHNLYRGRGVRARPGGFSEKKRLFLPQKYLPAPIRVMTVFRFRK